MPQSDRRAGPRRRTRVCALGASAVAVMGLAVGCASGDGADEGAGETAWCRVGTELDAALAGQWEAGRIWWATEDPAAVRAPAARVRDLAPGDLADDVELVLRHLVVEERPDSGGFPVSAGPITGYDVEDVRSAEAHVRAEREQRCGATSAWWGGAWWCEDVRGLQRADDAHRSYSPSQTLERLGTLERIRTQRRLVAEAAPADVAPGLRALVAGDGELHPADDGFATDDDLADEVSARCGIDVSALRSGAETPSTLLAGSAGG